VISLLVVVVVALHDRFGRIAAAASGVVAGAAIVLLTVVGFAGREVGIDESASGRTEAWATGLTLLRSSPLWGVGFGNFTEHHDLVAHNSFVHCFAEVGLVGYFGWLAILALTWWEAGHVARQEQWTWEDAEEARWARACRLALAGFVAAAFFLSRTYSVLLFLVVGLATAVADLARRRGALPPAGGAAPWVAGIASLEVASVILFFVLVRLSRLGE
jgi:O-antigen ligase